MNTASLLGPKAVEPGTGSAVDCNGWVSDVLLIWNGNLTDFSIPFTGTIQGSDDLSSWHTLHTFTGDAPAFFDSVSVARTYRYLRAVANDPTAGDSSFYNILVTENATPSSDPYTDATGTWADPAVQGSWSATDDESGSWSMPEVVGTWDAT
jgi:hypothetical protein